MSIDVIKELEKLAALYASNPPTAGATLIHACIHKLKALIEIEYVGDLYRTDYEVEGEGRFPLDMLRYACSWPAREQDEPQLMGGYDADHRCVRLSTWHRDPEPRIAADRWERKFRWRVIRIIETVPL